MTSATRPVARLSTPGEIAAVVPVLCGFQPSESLVVVSLRGPRRRVGTTMRFDLDGTAPDPAAGAAEVAERLALDGADRALVVVVSEAPDAPCRSAGRLGLAWSELAGDVDAACRARDVEVQEMLLVRGGRWWSYVCTSETCCPAAGTELAHRPTPALQLVEAERVLRGRAVLASRDQLVASVALVLPAAQASSHAARARSRLGDRRSRLGAVAARAAVLREARALLGEVRGGGTVGPEQAATLAVAVGDLLVRDTVATWCLRDGGALLSLLLQTARQVGPPHDVQVLALLAWVAYAEGDGGLANVALERCLSADPTCSLGHLLSQALHGQLPPRELRQLLARTARTLRG